MLCLFCLQSFFKKHLISWAIGRLSFDGMLFANSSFLLVYSSPYSNQCTRLFAFLFTHLCSMILSYLAKQTIVIKLDTLWKFTDDQWITPSITVFLYAISDFLKYLVVLPSSEEQTYNGFPLCVSISIISNIDIVDIK